MPITNLITNPSFETDLAGWTTYIPATRSADWSWRGGWSMRLQGTRTASQALALLKLPGIGVAGKTIGWRLTSKVITNPGGLQLMAQTANAAGSLATPRVAMTPAPRDSGAFSGTGEWEWRGLYTPPADAYPDIYLWFSSVNGGTADVYVDAALVSFDLIDRSVSRPGEGLDVPPYGDGGNPEWEWEGLAHQSRSIRKSNKVNWTRNPSGEVDSSLAATSAGPSATTYDAATRIVPTRITSDLEAPNGTAVLEWQMVANASGAAAVLFGDSGDLPGTATPVSNQEVTVFSGWLRIMSALPSGATVGPTLVTYSATGQRQTNKGYQGAPPVGWAEMVSAALEEFPAAAGVTSVPNVPPKWALGGFLFFGLTPGATYTVRTDKGMFRRDHLGTEASSLGYYAYFDGATAGAVWLGTAGLSASDLTVVTAVNDTTPPAVPTGLTAVGQQGAVSLDWTDNSESDLAGYLLLRDAVAIFDGTSSSFLDFRATPGVAHNYTVKAYDTAGNVSAASAAVSGTALAEPVPEPEPAPLSTDDWRGLVTSLTIMDPGGTKNLVTNPSFELDTVGWRTGTGNYWLNSGGTLARSTGSPSSLGAGTTYAYANTPGTLQAQGVETVISGDFKAGVMYTASIWLYRSAKARQVYFGYASADHVKLTTATGTSLWVRHTVSWTPATNRTIAYFGIRQMTAVADTIEIDGAMVAEGGPRDYFDGDSDKANWTGTRHASASVLQLDLLQGVKNIAGLVGVTVDSVVRKRVGGHGSLINTKHRNDRVISISRTIQGRTADEAWAKYMAMSRAVSGAVDEERLLSWTLGNNLLRLQSLVRLEELEAPVVASPNRLSTRIDFRCEDPRAYSAKEEFVSFSWPSGVVNNAGTVGTLPQFVIRGPVVNPLIQISPGIVLRAVVDLKVGNALQFDARDRTVKLNGVDRYDLFDVVGSRWFELPPRDSTITYGASSIGSGSVVEVRWRHAYQ